MPLTLTLRRSNDYSPFRDQLLRVVRAPGNSVFLFSGFVDAGVFGEELIGALKESCSNGKLVLLAGMLTETNSMNWRELYAQAIAKLKEAGIDVSAYEVPRQNWHAKIALRMNDSQPVAAVIGSSNLTHPALSTNRERWNYECDVTMWHDTALTSHFRSGGRARNGLEYAELALDPEVKDQPDIAQRLTQLYDDLKAMRRAGTIVQRADPS
jgi:phosphatidylserine/phosphatidylglycerophosphate/cardiolipin synthase-like enzyme